MLIDHLIKYQYKFDLNFNNLCFNLFIKMCWLDRWRYRILDHQTITTFTVDIIIDSNRRSNFFQCWSNLNKKYQLTLDNYSEFAEEHIGVNYDHYSSVGFERGQECVFTTLSLQSEWLPLRKQWRTFIPDTRSKLKSNASTSMIAFVSGMHHNEF